LVAAERFAAADGFAGEGRVIDHHHEVRAVGAAVLVIEGLQADVDERVGTLLARAAGVVRPVVAFVRAIQGGVDDLGAFGVEAAVEDPDPVERA